jgi:hypothetical protein
MAKKYTCTNAIAHDFASQCHERITDVDFDILCSQLALDFWPTPPEAAQPVVEVLRELAAERRRYHAALTQLQNRCLPSPRPTSSTNTSLSPSSTTKNKFVTGYSRTSSYDQPRSSPLPVNADTTLRKAGPLALVSWSPVIPVEAVACVAGGDTQVHQLAAGGDPGKQEVAADRSLVEVQHQASDVNGGRDLGPPRCGRGRRQGAAGEREAKQEAVAVAAELDAVVLHVPPATKARTRRIVTHAEPCDVAIDVVLGALIGAPDVPPTSSGAMWIRDRRRRYR